MSANEDWTRGEIREALRAVVKRSMIDGEFRRLALTDSSKALSEVAGKDCPAELDVRFVDNAGAGATIVLPDPVSGAELSDSDLEAAAGGSQDFDFVLSGMQTR